jgi:hypothetical protein
MRSFFARLFLTGFIGVAVAGCGSTSGSAVPTGSSPNGTGGQPGGQGGSGVVSNQAPPGGAVPSFLIDGGIVTPTSTYVGYNVSGVTDTQSPLDAGADVSTKGSSAVLPPNPPGSHAITFNGNNKTQIVLAYTGTVGKGTGQNGLLIPVVSTGQVLPIDYGAIVLFASITQATITPSTASPTIAVELVGGSGATLYDVRAGCATNGTPVNGTSFERYVCDLPAYGSASGSYSTKYSDLTSEFSFSTVAGTLQNSASGGAGGTFTPSLAEAPSLYVVLTYPGLTTETSEANLLNLDYIYAEQGTQ